MPTSITGIMGRITSGWWDSGAEGPEPEGLAVGSRDLVEWKEPEPV